ncbi:acyl-CoA dehydrogenase family protein [Mycobacterium colombiense]|uniref:Acyl-CoA dehydrogenase n=1 Tax=Mycobacterium colombiense CECT 3035 TaxID=1041522 RepID=J4TIT4_9MYCO|nr:acyl-CoA dehydrogenase family protein [Mycobacterium colombiense]EJO89463.1 acyl-CoA dehydrogenase [Mycobacterium colombiense CECT 3035]
MDAQEVHGLRSSLAELFTRSRVQPETVTAALRDLGWHEVVAEEPAAESLLFEEHGRANFVSRLLDDAVLAALGLDGTDIAVAYPLAPCDTLFKPATAVHSSRLNVDAVLRCVGTKPKNILVPTTTGLLLIPEPEVDMRIVAGIDPDGAWQRVKSDLRVDASWSVPLDAPWSFGVAIGRRLLAAELVGLARAALDAAVAHVTTRSQFGRPIGSFQAVRFRLAEAKVAIESATEAVRLAFAEPSPLASAVAKALAGTAIDVTVRHAAQVCGAMGLTWEFPLHPVVRRGFVLDGLLGSAEELTLALGAHVTRSAELPQLDPLAVDA